MCRGCDSSELVRFLDLGSTPLADALVEPERREISEERFPLEVAFCPECALVQILEEVPAEKLFVDNYLYFSSYSDYLVEHAREHAVNLINMRNLGEKSLVVEIASNDGYLLKSFVAEGIPVLGIDPAPLQAEAARKAGVPTVQAFFGEVLAQEMRDSGQAADVIIANNVMAHVPDLNGFVAGMKLLLAPDGVITVENPSVFDLVRRGAFDTIYHEHFCYYSCISIERLVRRHGLALNDVEYFPDLHGGTFRWHISHTEGQTRQAQQFLEEEYEAGVDRPEFYSAFGDKVNVMQRALKRLLESLSSEGAVVAGYGAAAKGATLLNTVGIGTDLVSFVVDRNDHKQGRLMPGTHQPILDPSALIEENPDYVLMLAWNFAQEIMGQQRQFLERGGRFIIPVPELEIVGA